MRFQSFAAGARLPAAGLLALLAAGCNTGGTLSSFDVNDGNGAILSADKRAIIVLKDAKILSGDGNSHTPRTVVCAEPQPDAMRAVAKQFAAAFKAQAKVPNQTGGSVIDGSGNAQLALAASEAVASLGRRTPTVQLLRDALYRACENVANGVLGPQHVEFIASRIDNLMLGLHAIDGLTGMHSDPTVTIGTVIDKDTGAQGKTTADGGEARTGPQDVTFNFGSSSSASPDMSTIAAEVRKIVAISLLDPSCDDDGQACASRQAKLLHLAFANDTDKLEIEPKIDEVQAKADVTAKTDRATAQLSTN